MAAKSKKKSSKSLGKKDMKKTKGGSIGSATQGAGGGKIMFTGGTGGYTGPTITGNIGGNL